ncbi:hypothetical protein B0H10DRAFT_1160514 [Mycena sp. CBHHK59/15]|nr:hypothetical protein B0H10DRAFT_1160514 [Mycena sp. CBHHK59/15]
MMTQKALMTLVVRSLILLLFYILSQLPENFQVQLDPDLIVEAITFKGEDGRTNTGPWGMAPGHRRSTAPPSQPSDSDSDAGGDAPGTQNDLQSGDAVADQNELRSVEWVEWQKYEDHVVSHIPYLGRNGPVKTALSQPKKSRKMMQPESDADDEDDDLASDPDADTDDEEVLQKRAARDTRSKAQGAAENKPRPTPRSRRQKKRQPRRR